MRAAIPAIVKASKSDNKQPHMRQPEDAFLYRYVFPIMFRHMKTVEGIGEEEARQSLLSEYYRNMPEFCRDTPARKERHPFSKLIGSKPAEIVAQWKGENGPPLKQSCPDFAFRNPFPFKVVFEGKYFGDGGPARAQHELVTNIYQAFFYRGLPFVAARTSGQKVAPAWDYDFACLLAYDASRDGTLRDAWGGLSPDVKRGFWEGANVYVMVLRGNPQIAQSSA